MKIVINKCYGGFGLSERAERLYAELTGKEYSIRQDLVGDSGITWPITYMGDTPFYYWDIERTDPALIQVVEQLGEEASGDCATLKIVEIPDDVDWYIEEYDGAEAIHEKHRSWS